MRWLRLIIFTIVALVAVALVVRVVTERIARQRTEESLARQAAEIGAHRQAQRSVLVRATPEVHQELARTSALEGRTWNHPALADGFLLVRNAAQMAAFDLRPR